jgi:hypothetical protein
MGGIAYSRYMPDMSPLRFPSLALATALVALGCHDEHECPAEPPAITSFTVSPTMVAPGGTVTGSVVVANFELNGESHTHGAAPLADAPTSEPLDEGHDAETACPGGHVHVYLDDVMTEPLAMTTQASFSLVIPAATPVGSHTLIARLQNRDHTIIQPEISAEASVDVE